MECWLDLKMEVSLIGPGSKIILFYGRPLDGQPNNLLLEIIYPMVNGGMEEKNNLADNGVFIEISK